MGGGRKEGRERGSEGGRGEGSEGVGGEGGREEGRGYRRRPSEHIRVINQ